MRTALEAQGLSAALREAVRDVQGESRILREESVRLRGSARAIRARIRPARLISS